MDADNVTGPYQALRSRRPKEQRADRKPTGLEGSRFAPSPETPGFAPSSETPGSYVGQAGRLRRAGRFTRRQLYRFSSRRLPGMSQRNVLPIASVRCG